MTQGSRVFDSILWRHFRIEPFLSFSGQTFVFIRIMARTVDLLERIDRNYKWDAPYDIYEKKYLRTQLNLENKKVVLWLQSWYTKFIRLPLHSSIFTAQVWPENPGLHWQRYEFTPSMHNPLFRQGFGWQSLILIWQSLPVNPMGHVH